MIFQIHTRVELPGKMYLPGNKLNAPDKNLIGLMALSFITP